MVGHVFFFFFFLEGSCLAWIFVKIAWFFPRGCMARHGFLWRVHSLDIAFSGGCMVWTWLSMEGRMFGKAFSVGCMALHDLLWRMHGFEMAFSGGCMASSRGYMALT